VVEARPERRPPAVGPFGQQEEWDSWVGLERAAR
jgi:hypothetical protein